MKGLIGLMALVLVGCSGLDSRGQRVVSGMAIGGVLGCAPGAVVGAGIGYLAGHE